MTAYNRRFGKAPRHDFDVHRPLETDDDLTAFFTWREPRRVSKSLTVQYDKVLYFGCCSRESSGVTESVTEVGVKICQRDS